MFDVPRLKIRAGAGVYTPGQERVVQILEAALDILIESGYQAMTLREIARRCGIRMGAIGHYYKSRDDLVQDLLNSVIKSYIDVFRVIQNDSGQSAEEKLVSVISLILDDIQTRKTTNLFPELWALSNHEPFVAAMVDSIYIQARIVLNELISVLNPGLGREARETLALFVSASLEGMTIFAGCEKPWAGQMPMLKQIACVSLVSLVKTISSRDLIASGSRDTASAGVWRPPTLLKASEYAALMNAGGPAPAERAIERPGIRRRRARAGKVASESQP